MIDEMSLAKTVVGEPHHPWSHVTCEEIYQLIRDVIYQVMPESDVTFPQRWIRETGGMYLSR